MKKVGYRAEEAGGIEAAASTGGQILPPIMGAGAFLIAEYTGLPYLEVVKAGLVPAILYMGTVYVFVHLVAIKRNLKGIPSSELPRFRTTLAKGWHFLVALVVLMSALLMDFSVARVGFLSCMAVVALAALRAAWDRIVPGHQVSSKPDRARIPTAHRSRPRAGRRDRHFGDDERQWTVQDRERSSGNPRASGHGLGI